MDIAPDGKTVTRKEVPLFTLMTSFYSFYELKFMVSFHKLPLPLRW